MRIDEMPFLNDMLFSYAVNTDKADPERFVCNYTNDLPSGTWRVEALVVMELMSCETHKAIGSLNGLQPVLPGHETYTVEVRAVLHKVHGPDLPFIFPLWEHPLPDTRNIQRTKEQAGILADGKVPVYYQPQI